VFAHLLRYSPTDPHSRKENGTTSTTPMRGPPALCSLTQWRSSPGPQRLEVARVRPHSIHYEGGSAHLPTTECIVVSACGRISLELVGHLHAISNALAASQAIAEAHCHTRVTLLRGGLGSDLVGGSQERNTQKKGDKQSEAEGSHLEVVVRKDAQTMHTPGGTPTRPTAR